MLNRQTNCWPCGTPLGSRGVHLVRSLLDHRIFQEFWGLICWLNDELTFTHLITVRSPYLVLSQSILTSEHVFISSRYKHWKSRVFTTFKPLRFSSRCLRICYSKNFDDSYVFLFNNVFLCVHKGSLISFPCQSRIDECRESFIRQ